MLGTSPAVQLLNDKLLPGKAAQHKGNRIKRIFAAARRKIREGCTSLPHLPPEPPLESVDSLCVRLLEQLADVVRGRIEIEHVWNRRTKTIKSTKAKKARTLHYEETLQPLIELISREQGGKGKLADLPSERDMSRGRRRWLKKPGITRPALFAIRATLSL